MTLVTAATSKNSLHPLQAHGMENLTAWRGRKFSLATQKNKAFITESTRSNKILQNKRKYFRFYFVITK